MKQYMELINAKGYYCNMCDTYHAPNELKHRYTLESLGEWDGNNAAITKHEIICPTCDHDDELEPFDLRLWSHLRAYHLAKNVPMVFKYPLFDRETNGVTYGYAETLSCEVLEEIADWYCIEVVKVEKINEDIVVTVDFQ